ncbi:MAG: isopentenyl phosphate kinase [Candidatus Thorarchaeota archaeon]|jgi:isopentenyl phosphate kinase
MRNSNNLTIIKLGGSAITHKGLSPPQTKNNLITRISKELKVYQNQLIVVLGGGAYGHQAAHSYGFGNPITSKKQLLAGIPMIRHNMSILSTIVEEAMNRENIPAVVFPPFSFVILNKGNISSFPTNIIEKSLNSNNVVIIHGDVCFDTSLGASILSGDTITVYLANKLKAKNVFIGTNVDGVYDDNPQKNPDAKHIPIVDNSNIDTVIKETGTSMATDVTGGMNRKIRELVSLSDKGIRIVIFNLLIPGRLEKLLIGETVICTEIQL